MPKDVEARIRALPGNTLCADCDNMNPQWASVSYGTLHCLECSGHHRSLGVHLSFVRSVAMDSWTERQVQAMHKSGGNNKLIEYFQSRGIEKTMQISVKYNTKQAAYFKERLTRWLDGKTEPPPDPGTYDPTTGVSSAQGAEPLPGESTEAYNARQAKLREDARERLRAKFGGSGMGSMGGIGSEPDPGDDDGFFGKLGSAVGSVAGGAIGSLKQKVADGDVMDSLKRNVSLQDDSGARKGLSWVSGAVGGLVGKASEKLGDMGVVAPPSKTGISDDDFFSSFSHLQKPGSTIAQDSIAGGNSGGQTNGRSPSQKKSSFFDDDGGWGQDADSSAPRSPVAEDMGRSKSAPESMDMGRSKSAGYNAASAPEAPLPLDQSPSKVATPKTPAASAPSPAAKKKPAKLETSDDFFGEFGL